MSPFVCFDVAVRCSPFVRPFARSTVQLFNCSTVVTVRSSVVGVVDVVVFHWYDIVVVGCCDCYTATDNETWWILLRRNLHERRCQPCRMKYLDLVNNTTQSGTRGVHNELVECRRAGTRTYQVVPKAIFVNVSFGPRDLLWKVV